MNPTLHKLFTLAAILAGIFLALRFLLPLISPFLLGFLLALAAEPLVTFLVRRCHFPRGGAAALGVTGAFALLGLTLLLAVGLLVRQLRNLSEMIPMVAEGIRTGMDTLSQQLMALADRAPASLRPMLTGQVSRFFSDGSTLLDRGAGAALNLASGILSRVPGGALSLFTGIISSYMISAKLPSLRHFFRTRFPLNKLAPSLRALRQIKTVALSWLKAQLKLSGITFLISGTGFFLLGIFPAPLWGLLVAAVDAFPILGTGTVLVPWSLVSFLQGSRSRAFGLLGLYLVTVLVRSVLEPRLIGRQLGLDPLATLFSLYVGFRLFGLPGMLLAPMATVTAVGLSDTFRPPEPGSPPKQDPP